MNVLIAPKWKDYELLDSGDEKRLERFGKYVLVRPDPQIIWNPKLPTAEWQKADAIFNKISADNGKWTRVKNIPDKWQMGYQDIKFWIKLSPFKHTGVFPEQAIHWEWIFKLIKEFEKGDSKESSQNVPQTLIRHHMRDIESRNGFEIPSWQDPENSFKPNILNLFGYTGIASLAAAKAGAKVTHVDASYPTIGWARENQKLSQLEDTPIRWILDDALKFVQREIKRGVKYDGIIMDPPVYGHGPKGEIWDFNKSFPELMQLCSQLLTPHPLFLIVNAYAISNSSITLENVLKDFLKDLGGQIESGELALKETHSDRLLSTGIFARWHR